MEASYLGLRHEGRQESYVEHPTERASNWPAIHNADFSRTLPLVHADEAVVDGGGEARAAAASDCPAQPLSSVGFLSTRASASSSGDVHIKKGSRSEAGDPCVDEGETLTSDIGKTAASGQMRIPVLIIANIRWPGVPSSLTWEALAKSATALQVDRRADDVPSYVGG